MKKVTVKIFYILFSSIDVNKKNAVIHSNYLNFSLAQVVFEKVCEEYGKANLVGLWVDD